MKETDAVMGSFSRETTATRALVVDKAGAPFVLGRVVLDEVHPLQQNLKLQGHTPTHKRRSSQWCRSCTSILLVVYW